MLGLKCSLGYAWTGQRERERIEKIQIHLNSASPEEKTRLLNWFSGFFPYTHSCIPHIYWMPALLRGAG